MGEASSRRLSMGLILVGTALGVLSFVVQRARINLNGEMMALLAFEPCHPHPLARHPVLGAVVMNRLSMHDFIDKAIRHVELRQGMLGLKVKIMGSTSMGKDGSKLVMPDVITIIEPKDDDGKDITPQVISNQTGEDNNHGDQ